MWNAYCAQTGDPCFGDIISYAQNASLDQYAIIPDVGRVNNLYVLPYGGEGNIWRNNVRVTSVEFHERIWVHEIDEKSKGFQKKNSYNC